MSTTAARRRAMRSLIEGGAISSQLELVELLHGEGFDVTQATVSRDLKSIGAAKSGDRYVLGADPDVAETHDALARALDEFAEAITPTGRMIVIRTPPGAAQIVAAAIDNARLEGVVGTIAGDDTLLLIASGDGVARQVSKRLEEIGESG